MSETAQPTVIAWQPVTPQGVAAFAQTSVSRVLLFQFVVALAISAAVMWFLSVNVAPVISKLVQQLPEEAVLQNGELKNIPNRLADETKSLAVVIDLAFAPPENQTADLQIQFGKKDVNVSSIFSSTMGSFWREYPMELSIPLGRSMAEPWWGARKPFIIIIGGLLVGVAVFLSWQVLAIFYMWPVKILAYFNDRELSVSGSWKMASAALLPGALFMILAIFLYGYHALDLIRFILFFGLHVVIVWIYLLVSPVFLPKTSEAVVAAANPFKTEAEIPKE